jgi:hypothetical protein
LAVYLVSYELKNEISSADYQPLWDALNRLTSQKVQRSVWLVASEDPVRRIHSYLKQYMDEDDRLWVSKVGSEYSYMGAMPGTTDFLKNFL